MRDDMGLTFGRVRPCFRARSPAPSLRHADRVLIELQQLLLLLAVFAIKFPQADNLAHDLHVEAIALRLGEYFPDIGRQRRLPRP